MDLPERDRLARRRIRSVLTTYTVASERTLEAKISDAGPSNQRINPHILTRQLRALRQKGTIDSTSPSPGHSGHWYFLTSSPITLRTTRLEELADIHRQMEARPNFYQRLGQALEIAVYRALKQRYPHNFFGSFPDLDDHPDDQLYSKEEPPSSTGHSPGIGNRKVDFLLTSLGSGLAALEVKNTRPWIYPRHDEIRHLLEKAYGLDAVPVLIARRFHFLTFKLLNACGGIVHQVYNQRFPEADADLADLAKDKNLLGYFDIRLGNQPDERLLRFVGQNLPGLLRAARAKFDEQKGLLHDFVHDTLTFDEFRQALRVPQED